MKEGTKKILIVTSEFPPQPGGIGYHAYHLAKQFQLHNFQVTLLADNRSKEGIEETFFDKNVDFQVRRIPWNSIRFLMYLKRIYFLFKCVKNVNVVIASGKFSLWSVAFISLIYKREYIAVIHGTEVNFRKIYLKKSIETSLKRFSKIIAVSQYTKSLIEHLNLETIVIPNGYDPKKWKSNLLASTTLNGFPKIITVGNVTSRKGQLEVIKKLPNILSIYPEIQYHCVGLPTEQMAFSQIAVDLGVEKHVHFHGRLEDAKLQTLLMAMDVFVMLSKETDSGDVEGFGMALIEANGLGIPTIGTKGCGIEDAILDGKSGILISHEEPLEFNEALVKILNSYNIYKREAKKWADTHRWEDIIKRYISAIGY